MADLLPRMTGKIQLTSDGYPAYRNAVEDTLIDIDYGMLQKQYEASTQRYIGSRKHAYLGKPDFDKLTTAHVERQNLTMRTNIKRFARQTNAHSKKIENHAHAVALHFMYYNFARIHSSLRVTPAMAAGVTDQVWSIEDIAKLTS